METSFLPKDILFEILKFFPKEMRCVLLLVSHEIKQFCEMHFVKISYYTTFINFISENGYLNLLKESYTNKINRDNIYICSYAASGGQLDVLKWARNRGCGWGSIVSSCAANNGHLEVLKWCRENGCSWNKYTC